MKEKEEEKPIEGELEGKTVDLTGTDGSNKDKNTAVEGDDKGDDKEKEPLPGHGTTGPEK